ncbi:hypothetical protein LguiB_022969 [Lonicera macranthoides]
MAGLYHFKHRSAALHQMRATVPPLLLILQSSLTRSFRTYTTGGATLAQPQLDPDYYLDEDTHQNHHESAPHRRFFPVNLDTGDLIPLRGVQWIIIGSSGAKKHVFAEKLSKLLEVPHISVGSLVGQDLSPRSLLYKQIADAVNQGMLVPEEIIFGLLSKRLEEGHSRGETGFILNGIPRTKIQAIKQVEDYYEKKEKLLDIQVGSTPGETWQGLLGALGLHSPPVQS